MKKMKKTVVLAALTVATLSMLTGCGKKEEATTSTSAPVAEDTTATEAVVPGHEGQIQHPLTGEWIDEASYDNKRPITVMINNLKPAIPQAGVEKADIIYEVLVEGGITRLLGVFSDYSGLEKIGPIRSARHYYVKMALEYDSIYVHVGHSTYAVTELEESKIDHIDGTKGIGNVFCFRTKDRKAPHNCYSSSEKIDAAFAQEGFQLTHKDTYNSAKFAFNAEDTDLADGTVANKITTAYNSSRKPWFEYNATDKLYYRFQYGDKHIDELTGNQLAFKNLIVQFAPHSVLDAKKDLQEIDLVGTGEGFYASNGKIIPITWKKETDRGITQYFTADGEQLKMNPGKTFITIFKDTQKSDIIVE